MRINKDDIGCTDGHDYEMTGYYFTTYNAEKEKVFVMAKCLRCGFTVDREAVGSEIKVINKMEGV